MAPVPLRSGLVMHGPSVKAKTLGTSQLSSAGVGGGGGYIQGGGGRKFVGDVLGG